MNRGFFDHPNKSSISRVVTQAMPYWQHRNRFKNNHWEQERFNDYYPKESKCIGYATSGHLAASQHRQQTIMGPGGWTNKVTEFHSYNKAGHVGDGHQYTQMPGGGHRHDYGTNERKEGKRTFFAAQSGGHGMMMMSEPQQKRRRMGYPNNHGCSSHSDSEGCSESESNEDSDDCNDFEEKLTVHNITPKLKSSKRSYHIISNMNSYS